MSQENFYGEEGLEAYKESIEEYVERRGLVYQQLGNSFKIMNGFEEDVHMVVQLLEDDVSVAKRVEPNDDFAAKIDPVTVDTKTDVFRYLENGV